MVIEPPELPARLSHIVENSDKEYRIYRAIIFIQRTHESRLNNVEDKIEKMDKILTKAFNMKKNNVKKY